MTKGNEARERLIIQSECEGENIRVMECDLCSFNSVRTFAQSYLEQEKRLDQLICNAGLTCSTVDKSEDGFHNVIQANYLGHFLLTSLLMEKLKECRPSRVINVSSDLHQRKIDMRTKRDELLRSVSF